MPHLSLRSRLPVLRLLLVALLFAALAPSLSSLLNGSKGQVWVEVCTAAGTQRVALDTGDAPDKTPAASHCPYCRMQQDLPAVAHAPGVLVLADGSVRGVPPAPMGAPPPADAPWPALRSRAPPFFS